MRRSLFLALALALLPAALGAQVPPDTDWRTLESEHFRVTFAPGLVRLARQVAGRAEAVRTRLAVALAAPPEGTVDIVLTDHVDFANGFATPFPSNRIVLYAKPPTDHLSLANHRDWLGMALTHELTHIFHLDRTGGLGAALRAIFGRVPSGWPLFPIIGTPPWSVEGLATYFESRLTGAGRVEGSYADMVVRTAVLAGEFPGIDQANGWSPTWPGAQRRYLFGGLFLDYLARTYGPEAPKELVDATAGALIPPALRFDRVAERAVDESFTEAWREWHGALETRYGRLADSLRAEGLTRPDILTDAGRYALHPRVAPGGGLVAYAAATGRDDPATRLLDARTGESRTLARRNQFGSTLGPASWLPNGRALVLAQFQFADPYRVFQDLYRLELDGDLRRLTRGARLESPDIAPDGRRIVAVRNRDGGNRLVVYDLARDTVRPLATGRRGVNWALPRWSPDGSRIAAERWLAGGAHDIVVLDTLGNIVRELTHDRAIDGAPAWSPDGRYVLFWSDRNGIPNLYAYDLEARGGMARLYRVTSVLTGAYYPDVSPDGRWLYFSFYQADGFHIARVPFDPETWEAVAVPEGASSGGRGGGDAACQARRRTGARPCARTARRDQAGSRPHLPPERAREGGAPEELDVHPYSPLPTLRPRYWLPSCEDAGDAGRFFGARTSGHDLVGRHAYRLRASVAPGEGRFQGAVGYRYAGLGNPLLGLTASRDWADLGTATLEDSTRHAVLSREDRVSVSATVLRRRWNASASLTVGGEFARERFSIVDARGRAPVHDDVAGLFARVRYGNARAQPFSISREDGVSVLLGGRRRWDLDPSAERDGGYRQALARVTGYRSFRWFGFADHVLAGRTSTLWRTGPGADAVGIGGASGASREFLTRRVGGPSLFLPVRGFGSGVRSGTRAWSASIEYRFPLALIGRGIGLWPIFFDRLSAAAFVDAGDAWCTAAQRTRDRLADCAAPGVPPLIGMGAELALDLGLFFSRPFRLRAGVGYPVSGPGAEPVFYVRFGPSF